MSNLDYGKNYRYAHNELEGYVAGEKYFPEEVDPVEFYRPTERGLEKKIIEKLNYLRSLDADYKKKNQD